jgi:alpha-glucosidase
VTWWKDGVLYQVYPRSFADSDGDGNGDLPGLIERLDYLEWLGVDGIWLSPTFPSPNEDWGYDVADYRGVHPDFGRLDDVDRLIAEAGRRGISVLLDLVPGHTSDRHPWFLGDHRDWYIWADRPTNWRSVFGGSAWQPDEREGRYYLHSFLPEMPDLNWHVPTVRDEFDEILRFWFDRGIAGFRIDVVHRTVKDVRLRDAAGRGRVERFPPIDLEGTHEVIRRWRGLADGYDPGRLLVGETYVLDVVEMAAFYGAGDDELHLAFNFPFLHASLSASALRRVVELTEQALPEAAWPVWTLSNHDHSRFPTRWCGGDERKVRCALLVLLMLRGTPVLYYGDELGLEDGPAPEPPLDRARPPRDACRTPMPWTSKPPARSWLPPGDLSRNAEDQRLDPGSVLHLCRALIALRREFAGEPYETLPTPPGVAEGRGGRRRQPLGTGGRGSRRRGGRAHLHRRLPGRRAGLGPAAARAVGGRRRRLGFRRVALRLAALPARAQRVRARRLADRALGAGALDASLGAGDRARGGDALRQARGAARRGRDDGDDHLRDLARDRQRPLPPLGRLDRRRARPLGAGRVGRR